jgi:hypothetical protein
MVVGFAEKEASLLHPLFQEKGAPDFISFAIVKCSYGAYKLI